MSNKQVWTEDGRSGEKVIREVAGGDGHKTVYEELWVEPKVEKRLAQRQVKHIRPIVHRIETEIIDEDTQEVLDRKVEDVEPESKMELRRHIVSEATLSAQSEEDDDCGCYVTRDELKEVVVQAVQAVANNQNHVESYDHHDCCDKSLKAQSVLEEKYSGEVGSDSSKVWVVVLASACAVLAGGIAAVFMM